MDDQRLKPGSFLLIVGVFLVAAAGMSNANIAEFDEHWEKRREAAEAAAKEVYKPDPFNVTNELNHAVIRHRGILRRELSGKNSKYKGPCLATNPMDRCWRCRKDWATDRKRLARCAMGFGRGATGGVRGKIYIVTDPSDGDAANPRYGTLRWGAMQAAPLWITFAKSMVIRLTQELLVASDKTIDGRGAQVHVARGGAGITVQFARNVIITNLHVHDVKHSDGGVVRDSPTHVGPRTRADGDGISLFAATDVWVDHISMSMCEDGLIDVVQGSTGITKHYAPEWEWKNWAWHSDGDLFMNGAYFQASNGAISRKIKSSDMVKPKPGSYVRRLTRFAGALSCRPGEPC
uniref:Pectate lyase n=1 Tax=Oryza punctata TaxID=4537 RepID=A0A0E0JXA7_ORYPU